ncbi:MAG: 4-phosphoerythronate dehydrogenase PdxB [Ignavibacteriales bacterium]|nr:4-phosphoerythronate dehydrogenase PdxB [Ignavibacteriales bacterium]MCB9211182.1 4-phosphoerythronate dehydrogenase PdxB [Ignavibacteriales bacterium]
MKIIADDKIPFLKGVLEPYGNIEYYPGKEITKDKIIDADALIIRTRTKCNADLLYDTNVKLITTATIGYDHIDTNYCEENNLKWLNAPGCNSLSVHQYITTVLLHIAEKENIDLTQKVLGIVGVGNVGSKIQKAANALGMKILLNDPPRERNESNSKFVSLEKIKEEADIITFHVPLNNDGIDKTYHLADEKFFNELNKMPIIINSSRGEVVETSAIKNAIKNKKVSNVILDVWENEPEIDLELLEMTDISTPHIAGYSAEGKANGTSVCVNAVNKFFNLGIQENWYPTEIPLSKNGNEIEIDCSNKNDQQILSEAVSQTYDLLYDSILLKKSPETFEKQRGDYPIRREFSNYKVKLKSNNSSVEKKIKKLGFKILNN